MSLKLTKEGAYGYISVLIAKSPSIATLMNIMESSEAMDIQSAISRGILGSEYSVLLQPRTINDAEDSIYNFYKQLLEEVAMLTPKPYDGYVNYFVEIFDIDKVISLMFTAEKQKLKMKHIISRLEPLVNYIVYLKKTDADIASYLSCINIGKELPIVNTVECFIEVYAKRVISALDKVGKLEAVDNSLSVFYEFSILRLYKYITNSRLLLKMPNIAKLEEFAKEIGIPAPLMTRIIEDIKRLDEYVGKDLTLYTVYELKSIYDRLKYLLYTPHSFIDRLTYFLIHKFYEAIFVRYLVLHRYTWR